MTSQRLFSRRSDQQPTVEISLPDHTRHSRRIVRGIARRLFNNRGPELPESAAWGASPIERYFGTELDPEDRWHTQRQVKPPNG
jgi:hypothetical protein